LNLITLHTLIVFENLQSNLEAYIQSNIKLHLYMENLKKNAEIAYHQQPIEIQDQKTCSSHSDQAKHILKINLGVLMDKIWKAN
jgi:hypothetical protein